MKKHFFAFLRQQKGGTGGTTSFPSLYCTLVSVICLPFPWNVCLSSLHKSLIFLFVRPFLPITIWICPPPQGPLTTDAALLRPPRAGPCLSHCFHALLSRRGHDALSDLAKARLPALGSTAYCSPTSVTLMLIQSFIGSLI